MVRILLIILLMIWATLVFQFSSQNGAQSSELSGKVIEIILTIKDKIIAITENYKEEHVIDMHSTSQNKVTNKRIFHLQKITRKIAHFILYTIGGMTIYLLLSVYFTQKKSILLKMSMTLILGIGYAISDEYHQKFTLGRSPRWLDIQIDSLGIITGIIAAIAVVGLVNKIIDYLYERRKLHD